MFEFLEANKAVGAPLIETGDALITARHHCMKLVTQTVYAFIVLYGFLSEFHLEKQMTLPIRRTDNLLISAGTFEGRQPQQWAPGDRADIVGKVC